jgi:DNA-binding MarR family transcriptional regulator
MNTHITPRFYLSLLEFLLSSKQQIMAIGVELDLTSMQAITLLLIDENHPRPMKNFCLLFHCDASNVTGIVDGLEKKGLVSRQSDANDRRIKVIQLEPAGKQIQQTIMERLDAANDFMLARLSDTEQQQFVHIVQKLTAND